MFMIGRNDPCWCGSKKKWKNCHFPEESSSKKKIFSQYRNKYQIILKNDEQIEKIRKSCQLAASILEELCLAAKEGVTTNELDLLSQKLHKENHAIAAPYLYGSPPFPKTICTSLNEVICHGIPNDTPLKNGDILNIDVSCILDGYFGDCSKMVAIGEISKEAEHLIETVSLALDASIKPLKPELPLSEIGKIIEKIATERGCSVVYQFVGHGVGLKFHEAPQVLHYKNSIDIPLAEGMIFTIEPMINLGVPDAVIDPVNKWEARTQDGKLSGQKEHTILITSTGHEILTHPINWIKSD